MLVNKQAYGPVTVFTNCIPECRSRSPHQAAPCPGRRGNRGGEGEREKVREQRTRGGSRITPATHAPWLRDMTSKLHMRTTISPG